MDSTKKKIISRVIIVFIGLALAILGCIAAINYFSNQKSIRIEKSKISGGKPWINSNIKENISTNTAIDPKDDFHLYVNKEWILKNTIPEGYSSWSYYQERALEVKKQGINLLKDKSIEGHDANLVRTYNNLILDWNTRNANGVSELIDGYRKIIETKNIEDITKLLTDKETVYDYYNFIDFYSDTGYNNPETYLVTVDTPSLLLTDSAEYSKRTEYGDMYYGLKRDMFIYMGKKFGMKEEDARKHFDNAMDLEMKLASKIYTTNEYYSDDYYEKANNEMSFYEMSSLSKIFPLSDIIASAGYKYGGNYLVTTPKYLTYLDEIYKKENIEKIKSLLIVKYMLSYTTTIDRETYDKYNELSNHYLGQSGTLSDDEMAYNSVIDKLSDSMQIVYIKKYGREEDRKKMIELCQMIIDTYRELLLENDWLSDETKKYAVEKLNKMTINVAYPDKFNDTSKIDITGQTLLNANKIIELYDIQRDIENIGQKVDHEKWADWMSVTSCNAFYSSSDNSINMLLGMMGEPYYSSDMSVEELYASIAAYWVGHEISHAFDNNGAQFDANGVYKDWWTPEDKKEFKKRVEKMDNYLDKIIAFGDYHFIGSNIDTEMIADMTGLQCALRMASKIDGFEYQKFFIKYAQLNTSIGVYSRQLNLLTQDSHPLDYSRTNVPVQQFEEFYKAFDVKEGDNMYLAPEDRLIIW